MLVLPSAYAETPVNWLDAETEISDYEGLETLPVAQLSSRLIPEDPRWDPWLRLISEPLPMPAVSSVAPRRIAGWTLAMSALLVAVFLGPMSRSVLRKVTEIGLVLTVLALALYLIASSGPSESEDQKTDRTLLFHQHLWYQSAYPYGVKWEDYRPGEPVVIVSVARQGNRLEQVSTPVLTFGAEWERKIAASLSASNAARLLGLNFP